jgi:hypothetical protein
MFPPTVGKIHYTDLQPAAPNTPLADEWEAYRAGVSGWLAAGRAGQVVAIRGGAVIGFWDSFAAARTATAERYPGERVLFHEVAEWEPLLKTGYNYQCRD